MSHLPYDLRTLPLSARGGADAGGGRRRAMLPGVAAHAANRTRRLGGLPDPVKGRLVATVRGLDTRSWRLVLTLFLALGHLVALRTSGAQCNQVVLRH